MDYKYLLSCGFCEKRNVCRHVKTFYEMSMKFTVSEKNSFHTDMMNSMGKNCNWFSIRMDILKEME